MMSYKVNIQGIDIQAPRLKHEQTMKYIDEYQATKDESIKELLVIDNARLVLSMTKRFVNRTDSIDDVFQVGMIGLIKAIENFNTSFNLRFSTYAVPLILGEMKRYLRDYSSIKITRTIRDLAYKALQVKEKYIQDYSKEPTTKQISEILEVSESQVVEALNSTNTVSSLHEEISQDDGSATMMDQMADKKVSTQKMIQNIDLLEAIKALTTKEKDVIEKRYFEGCSQMEIASDLFISQAQVSRIEKQALSQLNRLLN